MTKGFYLGDSLASRQAGFLGFVPIAIGTPLGNDGEKYCFVIPLQSGISYLFVIHNEVEHQLMNLFS
jgi:hypothetical protein